MSDRIHVTDFQMSKSIYFDIPKIRFLHGPISMRYRTAASVLIAKSWKPWQGRCKGCAHLPAIKNLKRWKWWKLIACEMLVHSTCSLNGISVIDSYLDCCSECHSPRYVAISSIFTFLNPSLSKSFLLCRMSKKLQKGQTFLAAAGIFERTAG